MKINSIDNQPRGKNNLMMYVILGIGLGFFGFLIFSGVAVVIKWVISFVASYWHFMIIGLVVLLFLRRWFKKKEVVIQRVENG